ncbi:MAG: ArsA family ATPase [Deltaproteobacteria bacterium]|nr:ArsA family ATPase [Deltaproteobacteria bacterium]
MKNFLEKSFDQQKILICCGSGGVGKTSISCAIALAAAIEHKKRVLVLTIDPARRLAQALGFDQFSQSIQTVIMNPQDSFDAAMLAEQKTFDDLILRLSPSRDVAHAIFQNSIYQHVSSGLSGIHEYMAAVKLHELYESNRYDLIILDTPPMRKALDFLQAPQRVADFFDAKIFHWFLKPYFLAGKTGLKFLFNSSSLVLKLIERFSGMEVLQALHSFFVNFGEIEEFYQDLKERKLNCLGFIINQVLPQMSNEFEKDIPEDLRIQYMGILEYLEKFNLRALYQKKNIAFFVKKTGIRNSILYIPELSHDIVDLQRLQDMSIFLRTL